MVGKEMMNLPFGYKDKIILAADKLTCGIYFYKVFQKERVIAMGKMVVE